MIIVRLFIIAVLSLIIAACSDPIYKITIPEGKNFSLVMPCEPKIQNESSTFEDYIVQSKVYRCHGLEYAYVVTYSEYPIDVYKEYSADELLAHVIKRIESADPPFEFISKKDITVDGIKATQINSRLLSPRALYKSVVFYAGDGIYQVAYSAKPEVFESPKADAFYASLNFGK